MNRKPLKGLNKIENKHIKDEHEHIERLEQN
jgi:hypothetical protein